ncbi:hypothetical protein TrispH2_001534 [Trichoplax sp. H2]|nr:hypothetical protein TrispH2_001534 [Trichoplax sp. H2]|eukprot:RDD46981.1 hypothetical protein TrispH2_001534 [Trichoplax sp. H2]
MINKLLIGLWKNFSPYIVSWIAPVDIMQNDEEHHLRMEENIFPDDPLLVQGW